MESRSSPKYAAQNSVTILSISCTSAEQELFSAVISFMSCEVFRFVAAGVSGASCKHYHTEHNSCNHSFFHNFIHPFLSLFLLFMCIHGAWHTVDLNQLYETQTSFHNMLYAINSIIYTMAIFTHRTNVIIKTCVSCSSLYLLSRKKLFQGQKFLN